MNELYIVDQWLYTILSADATLRTYLGTTPFRFYSDEIPQEATYPSGIWKYISSRDLAGVGAERIFTHALYQIKIVGQTSDYGDIAPIAKRMDEVLQRSSGSVADGSILSCVREMPFRLPEKDMDVGVPYRQLGGLYTFTIQPAT